MIWKSTNETLCEHIARILSKRKQVKVEVEQTVMPRRDRTGDYTQTLAYIINGKREKEDDFGTDDNEPLAKNQAKNLSDYVSKHLEGVEVAGPEEGQNFFIIRKKVAKKDGASQGRNTESSITRAGFLDRYFSIQEIAQIMVGVPMFKWDPSWELDGGAYGYNIGARWSALKRSPKTLERNYDNFLKQNQLTSE